MNSRAEQVWIPYCGIAPHPADWMANWNLDPLLLAAMAAAILAWWKFRNASAAKDRAFVGLIAMLALLFVSPFCALGSALFAARVVHHLALVLLVAPLAAIVLGRPIARIPGSLALWTGIQAAVFWMWHVPAAYSAALSNDALFWIMQASIAGSAAIWWQRLKSASAPAAVVSLLATMVLMGLLGALLTFAGTAFYAPHWLTTQSWSLSPLEDQQIGGLIMWAPGSAFYLLAALAMLMRHLGSASPVPAPR